VRNRMSLRKTDLIHAPQHSPPTDQLCQYTSHTVLLRAHDPALLRVTLANGSLRRPSSIAVWRRCDESILATSDRNVFYTIVATNEDICDRFARDKHHQTIGDRSLLAKTSGHTETFWRCACQVLIDRRSQPITNLFLGHPDLDGPESRVVFSKRPLTDTARRRPGDGNNDYQPEISVLAQPRFLIPDHRFLQLLKNATNPRCRCHRSTLDETSNGECMLSSPMPTSITSMFCVANHAAIVPPP